MDDTNVERLLGRIDQHVRDLNMSVDVLRQENLEAHKTMLLRIGELETLFTRMDERTDNLRADVQELKNSLAGAGRRLDRVENTANRMASEHAMGLKVKHYGFILLTSGIGVLCVETVLGLLG